MAWFKKGCIYAGKTQKQLELWEPYYLHNWQKDFAVNSCLRPHLSKKIAFFA